MGKMLNKEHQHLFGLESSVSSSEQGFLQLFTSSSQKNLQIFQQFAECGMEELITLIVRNYHANEDRVELTKYASVHQ